MVKVLIKAKETTGGHLWCVLSCDLHSVKSTAAGAAAVAMVMVLSVKEPKCGSHSSSPACWRQHRPSTTALSKGETALVHALGILCRY